MSRDFTTRDFMRQKILIWSHVTSTLGTVMVGLSRDGVVTPSPLLPGLTLKLIVMLKGVYDYSTNQNNHLKWTEEEDGTGWKKQEALWVCVMARTKPTHPHHTALKTELRPAKTS